jgi:hypothetical protein
MMRWHDRSQSSTEGGPFGVGAASRMATYRVAAWRREEGVDHF